MNISNLLVLAVAAGIVALAVRYILREKKRGVRCIGCPDSKTCSGHCAGCSGKCGGAGSPKNTQV